MRRCPLVRDRSTARVACLMVLAAALLGCVLPRTASAESFALSKVQAPYSECGECMAIRVPTVPASSADASEILLEGSGKLGGLDPKDLREASDLPATGGSSQTVAIVDAYNDPDAQSDLEEYRKEYKVYFNGTETKCTETNGCFKKIDVAGETEKESEAKHTAFPAENPGWSGEISLDLDMVSAACPECHILLVEANEEGIANLGPAEEEAVAKKPTEITNSWGHVEYAEETIKDRYFDHPGVPIFAAGGDVLYNGCEGQHGAGICYPAASPYVISVGGVKLTRKSENWTAPFEEVWKEEATNLGTGSGCSKYEPKPPGQKELPAEDSYCEHRLDNDVAAEASRESAVSVYDTYDGGWENFGGTSAATPFVAGVEAHATSATQLLGANAFYKKPSMLFDVTNGNNGTCTPPAKDEYFCTAETGYDGPTGEGTPDNVFTSIAPAAATGFATNVKLTEATLNGIVNPNGATTKYYFQYGTTEAYGKTTAEASVSAGTSDLEESKAITGLKEGTTYYFRFVVTNSNGTTYGLNQVLATTIIPPENTVLPAASPETPDQAVPESTTTGTWANEPTSYAYQWERCNATGGECAAISGATASTYTPSEADVEHTLVAKVTARNSAGEATALSKATKKVRPIGEITEYELPPAGNPAGIVAGPEKEDLWFTNYSVSKIGKITTSGTITEYSLSTNGNEPYLITVGPDGNLWFTDHKSNKIGKITTSGAITEYPLPEQSQPIGIVAGPEKTDLWFTESNSSEIGKITTSGTVTEYFLPKESQPAGITAGPDGNLWFTDGGTSKIGKITTSGAVTEYSLPPGSEPRRIMAGPDGNLWFTDFATNKIGKITTSGTITEYSVPTGSGPEGITAGPDRNLWFTVRSKGGVGEIGRITTSGTITEYSLPKESQPVEIATGPDGNLWFTDVKTNKIGKITP
jgi:streptogramin lyase